MSYTGRELDPETGNYYYRTRYYNPATGRLMSEDTIGFSGGDTNLYRYGLVDIEDIQVGDWVISDDPPNPRGGDCQTSYENFCS